MLHMVNMNPRLGSIIIALPLGQGLPVLSNNPERRIMV
jgi:hypothetical protein